MANPQQSNGTSNSTGSPLNMDFVKSQEFYLRVIQAVAALLIIILSSVGPCGRTLDSGRYGFCLFVALVALLEAIALVLVFTLKRPLVLVGATFDTAFVLLISDGVILVLSFIMCNLTLLSIGRCVVNMAERVFAGLFTIALFLTMVFLTHGDYVGWQKNEEDKKNQPGTTITESSPTVLT